LGSWLPLYLPLSSSWRWTDVSLILGDSDIQEEAAYVDSAEVLVRAMIPSRRVSAPPLRRLHLSAVATTHLPQFHKSPSIHHGDVYVSEIEYGLRSSSRFYFEINEDLFRSLSFYFLQVLLTPSEVGVWVQFHFREGW
jgi:hypothetical protein